jgi:tetratricopeptide (TPR) repeat protein
MVEEQAGDLKGAEGNYRKIISLRPDIALAKARLSRILIKTGKRNEAITLIEDVSGMTQSSEDAGLTIGLMLLEEGLYPKAIGEFAGVLKKNPRNEQARYLLALTQMETGDLKGAKENLAAISPSSDEYVESVLLLTNILIKEKQSAAALDLLLEARKNYANSPQLLVATGRVLEDLDRLPQARDLFLEGARLFPDAADIRFFLGVVEDRMGQKEACIKAMRKAVSLDPEYSEALNYLAYTFAEENRNLQEALTLALKANTLKPDNGYYVDTLAWVYYRLGDLQRALPLLERAAQLSQEDPVVMEHLGDVLFEIDRPVEAKKAYQRAVEKGHETPETVNEKLRNIL